MESINKIKPLVKGNVNNKMDKKTCDKCNLTISYKNWSRHLKSIRHQTNDVDQTIKSKFKYYYLKKKFIYPINIITRVKLVFSH